MEKFIKIEDVEEFMEESYESGVCDTVYEVADLYCKASDIVVDILEDNGMTLSERCLVLYALELHSDVLNALINNKFGEDEIELVDDEFECDGLHCDECPFNEE